MNNNNSGFTLIEVMMVVAIIAIIAAIAMPSYLNQVTRTRCTDGIAFLSRVMQNQERFFTNNLTYTDDLTELGYSSANNLPSPEGFYAVTAAACATETLEDCVIVTGSGQGSQADADADLSLNSRGTLIQGADCQ